MLAQDRTIFSDAARLFQVWILVRQANPASMKYVGRAGYVSKRIDCKAKTADLDAGGKQLAGLVVDPTVWPGAYSAARSSDAVALWRSFAGEHGLSKSGAGRHGYAVERNRDSRHYGCVTLNGSYIFGDYDLFDIVIPAQSNRNLAAVEELHGQVHMRGARVIPVQNYINNRTGVKMVNHGGQAQAMHKFEEVDAFGPNGEQEHWTSAKVQEQYAQWKRSTLAIS
jgi:hypothetical protein